MESMGKRGCFRQLTELAPSTRISRRSGWRTWMLAGWDGWFAMEAESREKDMCVLVKVPLAAFWLLTTSLVTPKLSVLTSWHRAHLRGQAADWGVSLEWQKWPNSSFWPLYRVEADKEEEQPGHPFCTSLHLSSLLSPCSGLCGTLRAHSWIPAQRNPSWFLHGAWWLGCNNKPWCCHSAELCITAPACTCCLLPFLLGKLLLGSRLLQNAMLISVALHAIPQLRKHYFKMWNISVSEKKLEHLNVFKLCKSLSVLDGKRFFQLNSSCVVPLGCFISNAPLI